MKNKNSCKKFFIASSQKDELWKVDDRVFLQLKLGIAVGKKFRSFWNTLLLTDVVLKTFIQRTELLKQILNDSVLWLIQYNEKTAKNPVKMFANHHRHLGDHSTSRQFASFAYYDK